MAYIKTSWLARVGTALNRFLKTNETSTEVELTNDPTGVSVPGTPFTVANMNKIEEGIYDAHVGLDNNGLIDNTRINQDVRTTASPTFANATIAGHNIDSELDTLNGRVNQGVKTTDSPTFASINTGYGANKLYPMNQAVRTTDSPTFAKLKLTTSTYGSQEIAGHGDWVVPVGIYVMAESDCYIEVYYGSGWVSTQQLGAVISDGANVRIHNSSAGEKTIRYRKFS